MAASGLFAPNLAREFTLAMIIPIEAITAELITGNFFTAPAAKYVLLARLISRSRRSLRSTRRRQMIHARLATFFAITTMNLIVSNQFSMNMAFSVDVDKRGGTIAPRTYIPRRSVPSSWWVDYLPRNFANGFYQETLSLSRPAEIGDNPIYPERVFKNIFRVPFCVFEDIERALREDFDGKPDALGRIGHRAPIKILACLRKMGGGLPSAQLDDGSRIAASTLDVFFDKFCDLIITKYARYLTVPSRAAIAALAERYEHRGLRGHFSIIP